LVQTAGVEITDVILKIQNGRQEVRISGYNVQLISESQTFPCTVGWFRVNRESTFIGQNISHPSRYSRQQSQQ